MVCNVNVSICIYSNTPSTKKLCFSGRATVATIAGITSSCYGCDYSVCIYFPDAVTDYNVNASRIVNSNTGRPTKAGLSGRTAVTVLAIGTISGYSGYYETDIIPI
jgi:hypothetical protein